MSLCLRLIVLALVLLSCGGAFAQPVPPVGCTTTTCTGTALPLGYLTVAGNQLQSGPGNNVRLACVVYRGTGALSDFQAIRSAGFNCVLMDWLDAYLTAASPPAGCNTLSQIQSCVANAKTAGLPVIFSHLGNEIPAAGSACLYRQQNGLWFDSGTDSGGADGCSDTGTVTAATFQTNTVNLLGAFNGNSAVIGYEFHNEPMMAGTFTGSGGAGSGNGFTANNGQIFDPNGVPWVARGVNFTIEDACGGTAPPCSLSNSQVPLATLQRLYPRLNYVRVSNFLGGGVPGCAGACDPVTPSAISAWVATLTNVGIRVEFSDYEGNSGGTPCNTNWTSWYTTYAAFYAPGSSSGFGTSFVTWEGQNECYSGNGAIADWQNMNTVYYNAVRSVAPNAQWTMGLAGGNMTSTYELSSGFLAPFSNIIFDGHAYAGNPSWCNGCSQAATNTALAGFVSEFKAFSTNTEANIPFISGEFGDASSPGTSGIDPDGIKAVQAVYNIMSTGGATNTTNGGGSWIEYCGQPAPSNCQNPAQGDQLTTGGVNAVVYNDASNYGSVVQSAIAAGPGSGPTPVGSGIPPINWGGGGPTDIRLACSTVGAAVNAVNPGVVEFCPGPINNTGTTLLNGTSKTIAGVATNGLPDLSLAAALPVTGFPASKIAYSIHLFPSNVTQ